jgi:hypothetical protein
VNLNSTAVTAGQVVSAAGRLVYTGAERQRSLNQRLLAFSVQDSTENGDAAPTA